MTLILHKGAELVPFDDLRSVPTPAATQTHMPIPHHELVDMVKYALGYHGHSIIEEAHGLTPDGQEYFGLLTLRSRYGDYTDTCGLRNSHSKRFPIGVAFGSRVMVCDNLAFSGTHTIRRKHTPRAKWELPGLLAEIVEPLAEHRERQHRTFERYKATPLLDHQADHAILSMYRGGIINVTRIAEVVRQYDEPEHDWGDRTAWRLFNAATFALTGQVAENPAITRQLHEVIDGVCVAA